jgi:hypothetical protein
MSLAVRNLDSGRPRRLAGAIDARLAGGQHLSRWREGWSDLLPGEPFVRHWIQDFPALGSLAGDNVFTLSAEDVTPAPFNQPPYPPSGAVASDVCTVTGFAR